MIHSRRAIPLLYLCLLLSGTAIGQEEFTEFDLPLVIIDTRGQEIPDEERIEAWMGIVHNGKGRLNHLDDPPNNYSGEINIELRGSSSLVFPKKSYGFETQISPEIAWNVSLLELPQENDWILYAPYSDLSMIRNILTFQLSRELGQYAPRTRLCELVLNGDYRGVYVLMEKIKRDKNRVDIAKLRVEEISGDDVTGGYILKIDKQTGNSGPGWESSFGGIYFQYAYPKHDEIVPEQKAYIQDYIESFEQALMSENFSDPDLGFRTYASDSTFVDYFILNELSKNVDAYMLSTFFYKDKDSNGGKLKMGPLWDFNLSFGNAEYRDGYKMEGFQVHINQVPWWWNRLLGDAGFIEAIRNRWNSLREAPLQDEQILGIIDSLALVLVDAQVRNFERWTIMGGYVWPNYYVSSSYEDEIDHLKTWIMGRLQWLDQKLYDWTRLEEFALSHRIHMYPNPFTDYVEIEFTLSQPGQLSLILYDLNGRQIASIIDRANYSAGDHVFRWDTGRLPSSVYLLELRSKGQVVSRKKMVKL